MFSNTESEFTWNINVVCFSRCPKSKRVLNCQQPASALNWDIPNSLSKWSSGLERGQWSEKTTRSRVTKLSRIGRVNLQPKSYKHKSKKASAMLYNLKDWIPINNSTSNMTERKFLYLNWEREMINTPSFLKDHNEVHEWMALCGPELGGDN